MPRLDSLRNRMSIICLSWNSALRVQRDDELFQFVLGVAAFEVEARAHFAIRLVDGIAHFVGIELGNDIEGRHDDSLAADGRRGGLQVDAATHGAAGERGLDDANCGIGLAG